MNRTRSIMTAFGSWRMLRCRYAVCLAITIVALASCSADYPVTAEEEATAPELASASSIGKGFNVNTYFRDPSALAAEIEYLGDIGANLVRFPLYFDVAPDLNYWFVQIDRALSVTERRGMTLVIDYHTPEITAANANLFVERWGLIASRYASRSGHIWYDLKNEQGNGQIGTRTWKQLATLAAQSIRQSDTRHKILYSPTGSTTGQASSISPLPGISNQGIAFHFWNWPDIQRTDGNFSLYPYRPYPDGSRTREAMRASLQEVKNITTKFPGTNVFIGEVGIIRNHPNAPRFLRDFTDISESMGIPVTIHSFDGRAWPASPWNYELNTSAWTVLTNWLAR